MAKSSASRFKQKDQKSAVLMEEMSIFADRFQVKEVLQEYLRRVLLAQPTDPIAFLINEIKTNPHTPAAISRPVDERGEDVKAKYMEHREEGEQVVLLKQLFDVFDPKGTGYAKRAEILVGMKEKPTLFLETFPMHFQEIYQCVEDMECGSKDGIVSWDQFSAELLTCLKAPGGRR
eukprot:CAMPEP_0118994156 /NCGR_PEP_ID=MMETSP1173-20130426/56351_1 /TAXON_ID=1034831 /ORGANISM="Rhizochromulina marina cf, Strain CCMP1243" /LENGTH=175 /DNA_ID=CAMNT_0006945423 /DNA_START=36 /DNA_END=563 /DNA_ORIENTATION=+